MVEAHRAITTSLEPILDELAKYDGPKALAINKIDRVEAPALLTLADALRERLRFDATFMISARRGKGVEDLRNWLAEQMPEGDWLYPEDQISDMPLRMIAAELTREQLTLRLHKELPYQLTVETEGWQEREDGSTRIDQIIYVGREGHKSIVLGRKGETIKAISQIARGKIEALLDRRVHLFTRVKTRSGWLSEAERYTAMGLDFKDSK